MVVSTLNVAESQIFSRGATYRLMPGLEHLRFNSIQLVDENVMVSTLEGDVVQSRDAYIDHYLEFRNRLPFYFEYVNSDYSHRKLWKYGCSVLPIGWVSQASNHLYDDVCLGQHAILKQINKFHTIEEMTDLLYRSGRHYGHLVANYGFLSAPPDSSFPLEKPYCSCGTFQMQWNHLDQFKQVCGADFEPTCHHIRYLNEFESLRNKAAAVADYQSQVRQYKTMAYWFHPPTSQTDQGFLRCVYIDDKPMRSIDHWTLYVKPISHCDVWSFFHQALDHGYALMHAMVLSSTKDFFKHAAKSRSVASSMEVSA